MKNLYTVLIHLEVCLYKVSKLDFVAFTSITIEVTLLQFLTFVY